jgi:hypothetical protein
MCKSAPHLCACMARTIRRKTTGSPIQLRADQIFSEGVWCTGRARRPLDRGADPLASRMRRPYARKVRFVQPVVLLLGVAMYIVVIAIFQADGGPGDDLWFLVIAGAWNLVILVATVIAIVDSVLKIRAKRTEELAVDAMVVKLASIPFFLINFAVLVFALNASIVLIFIGPILWTVIAIGTGLTYLTMLSTSVYVWATITRLRRERAIGTGLTVLYMILSLLFVTDIAAGVLLFGHSRRRPRLALAWLLLGTGVAMIVVGVLDSFFGFLDFVFPVVGEIGFVSGIDWLEWGIPVVAGSVVILVTGIVAVVRRSALRLEAQRAATAVDASTESDTSDLVPAG